MAAVLTSLIGTTSVLGFGLIPLLAIGLTIYRYNNLDPESHPQNAREVRKEKTRKRKKKSREIYSCIN